MAGLHNALRRDRLTVALKSFLGDTRSEGGLERYGETLTPTLDMFADGEINLLREELLFLGIVNCSAVAAELGYCGIGLPAASRDILVVTEVNCRSAAGISVVIGHGSRATVAATLTLQSTMQNRDQRAAGAGFQLLNLGARLESWSGTDPASLVNNMEEIVHTDASFRPFFGGPWIVKPGGTLMVKCLTVNTFVGANFAGRLRAAKPGELVNV